MVRLIRFELSKLWGKRSFLVALCALLLLHLFLLWYTTLSDGRTPELSAYRALQADLEGLTEPEKRSFLEECCRDIQGVCLVGDILNYRAAGGEMGEALARQAMEENPGVFEKYHAAFLDGSYLRYTGSLEQESALLSEVWEEARRVFGYEDFRREVKERRDALSRTSLFSQADSFSARTLQREAAAYEALGPVQTRFFPAKGVVSATRAGAGDLLLFLSVFLFAGGLVLEEKEKKLFFVTRATAAGRGRSILAKLCALGLHCLLAALLFLGMSLLFFACTAGVGDLSRSIQSVAPYVGSPLRLTVLSYLLLSALTKAAVLFAFGTATLLCSILARHTFLPALAGLALLGTGALLFALVPASSGANWLKYINFTGLMKTEGLYGGQLHFNLFGLPVSRLGLSWAVLGAALVLGCGLCAAAFLRGGSLELRRLRLPAGLRFRPHAGPLRHEAYKLLVMNRGLPILLLFAVLMGYQHLRVTYALTPGETYYQTLLLQLEGPLTPEKEWLLSEERRRYEEAFQQLDRIDALVASGEADKQAGEAMKARYLSETAFYPAFQRVLRQYDYVRSSGEVFVYDTGYRLLFGLLDNGDLVDYLLLAACLVLAFAPALSMEDQRKAWSLLGATARGRGRILRCKLEVCGGCALLECAALWSFRLFQVQRTFPLRQWSASTLSLGEYREAGLNLPLFLWSGVLLLAQLLAVLAAVCVVLYLSARLKNHLQALFFSAALLLVPPVLTLLGLPTARWCSLLPLYGGGSSVLGPWGGTITAGYTLGAALLAAGLLRALFRQISTPARC